MQAKEKSEAFADELYSLSDWYKISVRSVDGGLERAVAIA
jgi:hypothetical protein